MDGMGIDGRDIAVHEHEVGLLAHLDGADALLKEVLIRSVDGAGTDHVLNRHALVRVEHGLFRSVAGRAAGHADLQALHGIGV